MKRTFVDAYASYLETYVIPSPPASVINDHMGPGFVEANDNVDEVVEMFFTDHPHWITDNHKPISRELDELTIESVETANDPGPFLLSLPPVSKPEKSDGFLSVEMLVQYRETYSLPRITKEMVVDAGFDWEPGCGDEAIQEYLDQNWDDHKRDARLINSELDEVSFQDVSGFDPTVVGVKKLFSFKAVCTALEDYEVTYPKPRQVKAGDTWTLWPNQWGHMCREGDPTLLIAKRDTRLKIKRLIEREQREDRDIRAYTKDCSNSVVYEMVPADEQIKFSPVAAEVG